APVALRDSGLESVAMLSADNARLAAIGALATAIGWGVSSIGSTLLQDVHLPVSDERVCEQVYRNLHGPALDNFETQICGSVFEGGIDACQGDSGGPLAVRDRATERWMLAGVTSWGEDCALSGFPGVWGRVSALSDWARATAVEPSRVHRVTVRDRLVQFITFGNQSTLYQPSRAIEPRWQLTNLTAVDGDQPGQRFLDWRILDEADRSREFMCAYDFDGPGPGQPRDLTCYAGRNRLQDDTLREEGIYVGELSASLGDTAFRRNDEPMIVGAPPQASVDGELALGDAADPDWPGVVYYIDYFDIADLTHEKAIAVQVASDDLNLYVGLYDRDIRDANGSGGLLQVFFGGPEGFAETIFFPNPEVNYVIGVSTFGVEEVGAYSVTVVNDGAPIPTSFDSEMAPFSRLRKLPELGLVIHSPNIP
ncbi:MAG: trypsin-like serine protease, partial [Proteobacteria bacterium]|nr:trypsin-like serine protease [Pseudomonadota bacterium]